MKKPVNYAAIILTATLAASSTNAAEILGVNVSSVQGSINWTSVAGDGIEFAFVRATQGASFTDPDYTSNMVNGKAAGVQMGAYEFSEPYADTPAQEANYFWNHAGAQIKADGKSLYPCIDFEVLSGHVGATSYTAWFNTWAVDVKAKTTVFLKPVIMVEPCTTACALTAPFGLDGFIVNENGMSTSNTPWTMCLNCNVWDVGGTGGWTYWLFSTGAVSGIAGSDTDLAVYPNTLANLKTSQGVGGL